MDDFPSSVHRLDWGFGNPNKTATLIACLMVAIWALPFVYRKSFWITLVGFTVLGWYLIATGSRGGAIGAVCGCGVLVFRIPTTESTGRLIAVAAALVLLGVAALYFQPHSRLSNLAVQSDRSIGNRLLIWRTVPAMIRSAPGGWGLGRSGDAYMQWFQPIDRGEGYHSLVSSHFTWLVELGWPGRIGYVAFWTACFVLTWPWSKCGSSSIPLGVWVAFATCALFSSVAESSWLWAIPMGCLLAASGSRFRRRKWPTFRSWGIGALTMFLILLTLFTAVELQPEPDIHFNRSVEIGTTAPKIWLLDLDRSVVGDHFGHAIRKAYQSDSRLANQGIGIASDSRLVPRHIVLVLSGQIYINDAFRNATEVILVNPPALTSNTLDFLTTHRVTVIVGELSKDERFWLEACKAQNWRLRVVPGADQFIPQFGRELGNAVSEETPE